MTGGALRAILPTELNFPNAPCADDPELFFTHEDPLKAGYMVDLAQEICADCPYRMPCLEWALTNNEPAGVWGGMSALERVELLRGRTA